MRPHEGPEGAVMCRAQACVPGGLVCADEMQLGGGDRASAQQIPRWFVREFARQASPHKAVGDGTGKVLALHVSGRCALCKLHMKCRAPNPSLVRCFLALLSKTPDVHGPEARRAAI